MKRALQLAARGRGRVEPNPMVGSVIVRQGQIIGEGYHQRFGGPHAEVVALKRCSGSARGATVFVTLEPCCHHGKTPPCTEALISAGVSRVIAALRDPNPRVAGRGLRKLQAAGIAVEAGLLGKQAAELNAPYIKLTTHRRPWVILKWAQSLDGKIATHTGDSRWISGTRSREHAHRVRGRMDAIIVGRNTVATDNPRLTCRVGRVRRVATRIVLDAGLRTSATANLVRTAREAPTWFFCADDVARSRIRTFESAGCQVHRVPRDGRRLSLAAVLDVLGEHAITNVLVEGGGRVLGDFVDQQLGDEFHVYVAPLLISGTGSKDALVGRGAETVREAFRLPDHRTVRQLGEDWFIHARREALLG